MPATDFEVTGTNTAAQFTLKVHRGDGMALLAMNWKSGKPPLDFVGFAIEYQEPGGAKFYPLKNRLAFPEADDSVNPNKLSTRFSPIQKFRWVHFPRNAEMAGQFHYRVTPVFMNSQDELSYGESQDVFIELRRETYPDQLNVCYTRGFVSSQAFVERYESAGPISKLLPAKADDGLRFKPTHPKAKEAYDWMGFEARSAILELLDQAIADTAAQVRVVAYDLNEPEVVSRIEKLKRRVRVLIDNEGDHGESTSAETAAEGRLVQSAGDSNVKRQHMGNLQHNKTIVVDSPNIKSVVCGSTNFSWRGFFVQANNAIVLHGDNVVKLFKDAFDNYWDHSDEAAEFSKTVSASFKTLGLTGIDAQVGFSPHSSQNALLKTIADDIETQTTSSLLYSLAFLYQTPGVIKTAVTNVTKDKTKFVYGISDHKVGGIVVQTADGNVEPVSPAALEKNVPQPFKAEPTGGGGTRMHHKFVVIDFDKPTARVYMGSYNFSIAADTSNGENLLLIKDKRIAVSYMVEAVRLFDHYEFRLLQQDAKTSKKKLQLQKPPRKPGEKPWWDKDYTNPHRVRDRELFA
jgi:phosphatidylserine/phosphatidylglycerophosphate/cardiolipin synthase-like enzyme